MAIDGEPKFDPIEQIVFDEGQLDSALAIVAAGNSYNMPDTSLFDEIEERAKIFVSSPPNGSTHERQDSALRSLGRINVLRSSLLTEPQPGDYS